MTSSKGDNKVERASLAIEVQHGTISVSYLSSLLRVLQAALREVASSADGARQQFERQPQPILVLSRLSGDDALTLHMDFVDPIDGSPLAELSTQTFDAFLDALSDFVTSLPQPGLWGGAARRQPGPSESGVALRMDQVYGELRRASKVALTFRDRSIEIEGDRMELG